MYPKRKTEREQNKGEGLKKIGKATRGQLLCGSPPGVTSQICICPISLLAELAWVESSVENDL